MKIAWFDCSSGIAGDMILASLFDAGVDFAKWQKQMARLRLPVEISLRRVRRGFLSARQAIVRPKNAAQHNNLQDIVGIIRRARLPADVTEPAIAVFERLARAEAKVHGVTRQKVHFHEVGGYDCMVDIVGAVLGLRLLGVERVQSSPVNLGNGVVSFSHGTVAVPAPAVAELVKGMPVHQPAEPGLGELTTPTGAAILRELACGFGAMPDMTVWQVGYGAGTRKTPLPNVLRVVIGDEAASSVPKPEAEPVAVIETNIDDMNPELFGYVLELLLEQGALDVYYTPIYMKRNRPATKLTVIAPVAARDRLSQTILCETTSLGVRWTEMNRYCLKRQSVIVKTEFGSVPVKLAVRDGKIVNAAPEYESCRLLARKKRVPLKLVYQAALRKVRN